MRLFAIVGRIVLAAVFLYAAYTKLRQPWLVFAMSIDSYQLLPENGVLFLARTLPWLEFSIGALLLIGYQVRYVLFGATAILATFFGVMLRSYFKGLGIDCGCFGVGEALTVKTLLRDGSLVALAGLLTALAFRQSGHRSLEKTTLLGHRRAEPVV